MQNINPDLTGDLYSKAKETFLAYTKSRGLHNTPERLAILKAVCSLSGHFDVETLGKFVEKREHLPVSRATLYNTLNLLEEAMIVTKHHFDLGPALYECTCGTQSHHHLMCTRCGKIIPFDSKSLQQTLAAIPTPGFHPAEYSLMIYGICDKCMDEMRQPAAAKDFNNTKEHKEQHDE